MEADINEGEVADSTVSVRDTGQEHYQKMTRENSVAFLSPLLKSSTPIVDKNESCFMEQMPSLLRDDSGFSEGTFSSTPASNFTGTPCTSLVSPTSNASSSSHTPPLPRRPSLSGCEISPIYRKHIPIRLNRHRHSDPGFNSLAVRIQFMEDNVFPKQSQSDISSGEGAECESDLKGEIEEITSTTEMSLKRSVLWNARDRSRSCSRSPSNTSEELEASFQEMSLEEGSSESRLSPNSFYSSSPSSRPQSPAIHIRVDEDHRGMKVEKSILNCDKESDISTSETLLRSPHYEEECIAKDSKQVNQDFSTRHSSTPIIQTSESCKNYSPSPLDGDTVISETSKLCTCIKSLKGGSCFIKGEHNSKSLVSALSLSADVPDDVCVPTDSHISTILTKIPLSSPSKSPYNDRFYSCVSMSPSKSPHKIYLLKSPTKRCSDGQANTSSLSPQKVRRKMVQTPEKPILSLRKVKKNLISSNLLPTQTARAKIEQSPQYLHMDLFSGFEMPSHGSNNGCPIASEDLNCISDAHPFGTDSGHIGPKDYFHKVINMFSPPEPSRLIGRRVGLLKCDIIGEFTKQNFLGCLENVFKYLSDSDLISIYHVNRIWRLAVLGDPRSLHRYRKLRQAQQEEKLQQKKENVLGRLKDNTGAQVTTGKGPLSTVQQLVVVHESPETDSQETELMFDDTLRTCPFCNWTALVHSSENRATCLRANCAFVFCTLCFSTFHHPDPCKPLFHAASKADLAGTRKSKKHLKRL